MKQAILATIFFIVSSGPAFCLGDDIDIGKIRNPFLSPFDIEKQIIKTHVEPKPQKVDNKPVVKKVEPKVVEIPKVVIVPPKLKVNGIIWNSDLPLAIINDKIVGVGDKIEDAQILSVDRDGISFSFKGETFHARMQE